MPFHRNLPAGEGPLLCHLSKMGGCCSPLPEGLGLNVTSGTRQPPPVGMPAWGSVHSIEPPIGSFRCKPQGLLFIDAHRSLGTLGQAALLGPCLLITVGLRGLPRQGLRTPPGHRSGQSDQAACQGWLRPGSLGPLPPFHHGVCQDAWSRIQA